MLRAPATQDLHRLRLLLKAILNPSCPIKLKTKWLALHGAVRCRKALPIFILAGWFLRPDKMSEMLIFRAHAATAVVVPLFLSF
jgi:hypothetical protein